MKVFVLLCFSGIAVSLAGARPQGFGQAYGQSYGQGYGQSYTAPTLVTERTYTIRPNLEAISGGYAGAYNGGYSGGYSSGGYSSGGYSSANYNPPQLSSDAYLQHQQQLGGEVKVFKHLYAFAAPEEPLKRARIVVNAPVNTRKHYKLIFIKAPSSNTVVDSDITLPAQEEEKTQIYVLSKERPQQPVIRVRTQQASRVNKPEVVFVKYRTEEEAQAIANAAISGQNSGIPSGGELVTDGSVTVGGPSQFGSRRF